VAAESEAGRHLGAALRAARRQGCPAAAAEAHARRALELARGAAQAAGWHARIISDHDNPRRPRRVLELARRTLARRRRQGARRALAEAEAVEGRRLRVRR